MRRLQVGDQIVVIRGEDKGKRGRIRQVLPQKNAVVIEGVNVVKRHVRANQNRSGGILEVEAPINQSKVMLVDPETDKRTRVRFKTEDGKKQRIAKSGNVIAVPQK